MAGNTPGRNTPGRGSSGLGLSDLLVLGGTAAVCVLAGMGLGWLVDSLVNTFPIFALVGLALGIVGACAYAYTQVRTFLNGGNDS
jgi:putative F0F1-ATPase subunit (Ca2+/Mg2+ transporter)